MKWYDLNHEAWNDIFVISFHMVYLWLCNGRWTKNYIKRRKECNVNPFIRIWMLIGLRYRKTFSVSVLNPLRCSELLHNNQMPAIKYRLQYSSFNTERIKKYAKESHRTNQSEKEVIWLTPANAHNSTPLLTRKVLCFWERYNTDEENIGKLTP